VQLLNWVYSSGQSILGPSQAVFQTLFTVVDLVLSGPDRYLGNIAENCATLDSFEDVFGFPTEIFRIFLHHECSRNFLCLSIGNKKAQLSLTNPRDACEKFARFT